MSARPGEVYLGDAVYASFDGYRVKLRTGDGRENVVYLEPEVLDMLAAFVQQIKQSAEGVGNRDIEL